MVFIIDNIRDPHENGCAFFTLPHFLAKENLNVRLDERSAATIKTLEGGDTK